MKNLMKLNTMIAILFLIMCILFPMPLFIKGLVIGAVIVYLVFVYSQLWKIRKKIRR